MPPVQYRREWLGVALAAQAAEWPNRRASFLGRTSRPRKNPVNDQTLATAGPDMLREMIRAFAQKMMDAEVETACVARDIMSRMAYHETFWLTVGAASPVIALANAVAITDTVRIWLEAGVSTKSDRSKRYFKVLLYIAGASLFAEVICLLCSLKSLLQEKDVIPGAEAMFMTTCGLAYMGFIGLYNAMLRYSLRGDEVKKADEAEKGKHAVEIRSANPQPSHTGLQARSRRRLEYAGIITATLGGRPARQGSFIIPATPGGHSGDEGAVRLLHVGARLGQAKVLRIATRCRNYVLITACTCTLVRVAEVPPGRWST